MKPIVTLAPAIALFALSGCGAADDAGGNAVAPSTTILTSDAMEVAGDTGLYTYGDGGAKTQIRFPIATMRVDPALYHDVQRLGESGGVVAVLDSYGSRNGGARCANGRESWVRLFSIAQKRMTDAILAESCLDRLETSELPVTWQGDGFTINYQEPRRFRIVDGKAQSIGER
ncbi:hypothetical protein ACR720_05635 [Sphingomonas parapaucimobilis]|jgi:hypothetical protein|uniref:hypothetical protein n=1 Tax=Sphingomonas parapaucimobilis TaxID=28213 RepID=UPI0039EB0938